jgi:four helix bundle protein
MVLESDVHLNVVRDIEQRYKVDLRKRIFQFAVAVLKYLMKIPFSSEIKIIKYQLSKSATSIGANYEESQSSSPKEFLHRVRIALRESNESKYWLRILDELDVGDSVSRKILLTEANEISLMLGAIASRFNPEK